jgi:hypothetical protein
MSKLTNDFMGLKNEYQQYLINYLTKPLINLFTNMYKDCKKENKSSKKMRFYHFQEYLERIKDYTEEDKNDIITKVLDNIECDYFDDLLIVVFSNTAQILSANFEGKKPSDLDISIPNVKIFIYSCFLEFARKVYYNPKLIENNEKIVDIIELSIKSVISKYLPMKSILDNYLNNSKINKDEEENDENNEEENQEENNEEENQENNEAENQEENQENNEAENQEEEIQEDNEEEEKAEILENISTPIGPEQNTEHDNNVISNDNKDSNEYIDIIEFIPEDLISPTLSIQNDEIKESNNNDIKQIILNEHLDNKNIISKEIENDELNDELKRIIVNKPKTKKSYIRNINKKVEKDNINFLF